MLSEILKALLITSFTGTCLAAVIMLARPVTKKLFGSAWHYYIWLAVLLTMMLPVRFSLPKRLADAPRVTVQTAQNMQAEEAVQNMNIVSDVPAKPETNILQKGTGAVKGMLYNRLNTAAYLWLAGAVILLLINLMGYIRLIMKMRRNAVAVHCPEAENFTGRKLTVRVWENMFSPFMTGIFKPTLVLPARDLTEEQLYNILRHEMMHFKRHDILYKWFAALVKCLHWFNPVIWYVVKQINMECEISCDAAVTINMSRDEEMSYIDTILSLLPKGKTKQIPLTTQMAGSKRVLKRRFEMIKNKKKTSKFMSALSAAAAVVMFGTTVFAGGAASGILSGNASSWAKDDIKKAEEYSIIYDEMGITDYTKNITRGELCELAANVFVNSGVTLTAWEYPFTDVKEYGGAIDSLYCMGIVNGKTETEFRPDDYVTREEAASVLYRMYRYTGLMEYYPEQYAFADDGDISDWAKDAVYGLHTTHIMSGVGNDRFDPKSYFTTEQTISAMVKLYDILNESELTVIGQNRARQNIRVFYSCFNKSDFETMKNYCTQDCIDTFFGDGYVFGMKKAGLNRISFESNERLRAMNKIAVLAEVYMTPHENSVFDPSQTSTSFYMILEKQNDGSYLIDEFATGL
ncbi:MAG: M56 family metallopeptidase [bacterium]|nr:M56 family metallopeptidase [bacterium]